MLLEPTKIPLGQTDFHFPKDPWDWYIYLHLPYKSTIHVGKYTSPMDPMGLVVSPVSSLKRIFVLKESKLEHWTPPAPSRSSLPPNFLMAKQPEFPALSLHIVDFWVKNLGFLVDHQVVSGVMCQP